MKQRLTYALVSSAACIALTAWLVPYAPMPKAEGIGQIEVLGTIQGQYSAYVTRWLDTDEVRQGRLTYWIKTDYNGEPLYLYYYPPEFYVAYNGRWMHRLRGSEDAVQRLHEICLDACEQELADTIYW